MNKLLPQHQELIEQSAISEDLALGRGYQSITANGDLVKLKFARTQELPPGLLIPIYGPDGKLRTHQFRPDAPRIDKKKGKPIKYETPAGSEVCIDTHPRIVNEIKDAAIPLFVTEGSRKADAAISHGLCCVGLMGVWNWKNKNGPLKDWEQITLTDRKVYICYDSDVTTKEAVRKALLGLIDFLELKGALVFVITLPDVLGDAKTGLDDYLYKGGTVESLLENHSTSGSGWKSAHQGIERKCGPFEMSPEGTFKVSGSDAERKREMLCNFQCLVTEDIFRSDGLTETAYRKLEITKGNIKREITVAADQFPGMGWTKNLGTRFIIEPGFSKKDNLRAAIEKISSEQGLRESRDFCATGWVKFGSDNLFVGSAAAEIKGARSALSGSLAGFEMPSGLEGEALIQGILATLHLWDMAPDPISVPLFSAPFRAPLGAPPFAIFVVGPTGVLKTELASIAQRFFGASMDSQHLPGSWSSTANSLEEQAFLAKDCILVVDDYVPTGNTKDIAGLQSRAERLIRACGNGSGRGRLTNEGVLKQSRPPRCLIVSTGEDLPAGQSLRARLVALELGKGDVNKELLTKAQRLAQDGCFAGVMAAYLNYLSTRLEAARGCIAKLKEGCRREIASSSHARTPDAVAELAAGLTMFLDFALDARAITGEQMQAYLRRGMGAVSAAANAQAQQLREANPVDRFAELLRAALSSQRAHVCDMDGGRPLGQSAVLGWGTDGPNGNSIGWTDGKSLFITPSIGLKVARDLSGPGEPFNSSERALGKLLKERGCLISTDVGRGTTTTRKLINSVRPSVWAFQSSWLYPPESDQSDQSDQPNSNSTAIGHKNGQYPVLHIGGTDQCGGLETDQFDAETD